MRTVFTVQVIIIVCIPRIKMKNNCFYNPYGQNAKTNIFLPFMFSFHLGLSYYRTKCFVLFILVSRGEVFEKESDRTFKRFQAIISEDL